MSFEADLDVFLADGDRVTVPDRGIEGLAHVDQSALDAFGDRAQSTEYRITGRADVFGVLREGDLVVVQSGFSAGNYRARDLPAPLDDGALVSVMLSKDRG